MFEVWANQECTERPVAGTEYKYLYLQVNEDVPEQCPTPSYCDDDAGIKYNTCPSTLQEGDFVTLTYNIDLWVKVIDNWAPGVSLELKRGVYKLLAYGSGESAIDFSVAPPVSFGPELKV